MIFRDREEAGRMLSERLLSYQGRDAVVLAIPRGGVVVGYEVATNLEMPLDVIVPRKIPAPGQPELAIGAVVAVDGFETVLNDRLVSQLGVTRDYLDRTVAREQAEITRRLRLYRGDRPGPDLMHRTAILVDDGVATGYTMRAAIEAVRRLDVAQVVVAIPVAPPETYQELFTLADLVVCLATPEGFTAVGEWYEHFEQVSDEEVVRLLRQAEALTTAGQGATSGGAAGGRGGI